MLKLGRALRTHSKGSLRLLATVSEITREQSRRGMVQGFRVLGFGAAGLRVLRWSLFSSRSFSMWDTLLQQPCYFATLHPKRKGETHGHNEGTSGISRNTH